MIAVALAFLVATPCDAGAAAARQRDLDKARVLLNDCVRTPAATLESFLLLAAVHQARGDSAALYETARAAIRRFPDEKRFYLSAATHAGRHKQYADAIGILEPALKRWPDDPALRKLLASALLGRGAELLDAGENQTAADLLRRSTALVPDDADAQMNLGRALHNLGRYAEALSEFDRVQALRSDYPLLAFHRALSLHYMGEFDRAIESIANVKDYPPARLVRGLALLSRGSFQESVPELEAAVTAMPDDAAAQYGYARVLVRLGRLENAEPHLRAAINLDKIDPAPVNLLATVLRRLERTQEAEKIAALAAERMKQQRTARTGEIKFQGAAR